MTNKPLDCTGTAGPVGKCDIVDDPQGNKLDYHLNAIRALGYDVTLAVGGESVAARADSDTGEKQELSQKLARSLWDLVITQPFSGGTGAAKEGNDEPEAEGVKNG
jgi:hypothetical protein